MNKRKVYRPIGEDVVEKMFVGEFAECPSGWFDTVEQAKASWTPEAQADESQNTSNPPRRGRPPKFQPAG